MLCLFVVAIFAHQVSCQDPVQSQGCYLEDNQQELEYTAVTNDQYVAASRCRVWGYPITVLQGHSGGCRNSLPYQETHDEKCYIKCPSNNNATCGGDGTYSVHTTGPYDGVLVVLERAKKHILESLRKLLYKVYPYSHYSGRMLAPMSKALEVIDGVQSVHECGRSCSDLLDCDGFGWNKESLQCVLVEDTDVGEHGVGWITGKLAWGFKKYQHISPTSLGTAMCNMTFDLNHVECESRCVDMVQCTAFSWNNERHLCEFFGNDIPAVQTADDSTDGWNLASFQSPAMVDPYIQVAALNYFVYPQPRTRTCKLFLYNPKKECQNSDGAPEQSDIKFVISEINDESFTYLKRFGNPQLLASINHNNLDSSDPLDIQADQTIREVDAVMMYDTISTSNIITEVAGELTDIPNDVKDVYKEESFYYYPYLVEQTEDYDTLSHFESTIPARSDAMVSLYRQEHSTEVSPLSSEINGIDICVSTSL